MDSSTPSILWSQFESQTKLMFFPYKRSTFVYYDSSVVDNDWKISLVINDRRVLIRLGTACLYHLRNYRRDVVVVKWTACSHSTPTIRVRIPLKPKVFSVKFVLEMNENNQKEACVGPFLKRTYRQGSKCQSVVCRGAISINL